jgi:ABC-type polysaccharide/polyol phosphate transport system ATPase subunit
MPAAVVFEDVHKRYRVYQERYRSLKEIALHRRFGEWEDRWALRGVDLEVAHGETFGLIGPNGAGKSTALKLMARILQHDRGQVRVHGRLSGLLELAAGFQAEYTGRENVYLNASLLGLSRRDIDARFDRIVEFSELADHIDAPVRTYSSGMYMRLGFSVAIHVEPEIMVVDEILAVGDEAFQLKCYAWLEKFQAQGGTVILVSHNLGQVRSVCSRVAWIMDGRVAHLGAADVAVDRYLDHVREGGSLPDTGLHVVAGSETAKRSAVEIAHVIFRDRNGEPATEFVSGEELTIDIAYRVNKRIEAPVFGVAVHRSDDLYVYGTNSAVDGFHVGPLERDGRIRLTYRNLSLLKGIYRVTIGIFPSPARGEQPIDLQWQRHQFKVVGGKDDEGVARIEHFWEKPDQPSARRDVADSAR